MNDFFVSLAMRNLGVVPNGPPAQAGEVRPRPKATFEAEGVGVMPEAPDPRADGTTPEPEGAPVPTTPDAPASPDVQATAQPQTGLRRKSAPKWLAVAPTPPVPPVPSLAPMTPVTEVRGEIGSTPPSEKPTPRKEMQTEVAAMRKPEAENSDVTLRSEPEPRRGDIMPRSVVRPDVSAPVLDRMAPDQNVPTPRTKTTTDTAESREARAGATLERLVRRMVLMPGPAHRPNQLTGKKAGRTRQMGKAPDRPRVEPVASASLAPVPLEPAPARQVTDPSRLVARRVEASQATRALAPLAAPPIPPEPKASETVIHVRIGRIEVKAGPTEISPRDSGPRRPEPKLMSLDEYLNSRGTEIGR